MNDTGGRCHTDLGPLIGPPPFALGEIGLGANVSLSWCSRETAKAVTESKGNTCLQQLQVHTGWLSPESGAELNTVPNVYDNVLESKLVK